MTKNNDTQEPGATNAESLERPAGSVDRKASNGDFWQAEAKRAKAEAASLRSRVLSLEAAHSKTAKESDKRKRAKMKEEERWSELAAASEARIVELTSKQAAYSQRVEGRIVGAHIRSLLGSAGITNIEQQNLLMPGLRASVESSVSDDLTVTGDFSPAIQAAVEAFGLNAPPPPKKKADQSLNGIAAALGMQRPQPDAQPKISAKQMLRMELQNALTD